MIVMTRALARSFRAMARRCFRSRPRGLPPPVLMESQGGTLTLWAQAPEASLAYASATSNPADRILVPMEVLEAVEGSSNDVVELSVSPKLVGTASWTLEGKPHSIAFVGLLPGKPHGVPQPPESWHPMPVEFLKAVFECGRTADGESSRYALNRIQLRGKTGQVIGTDGRQALLWGGFRLPFTDDRLVPALPVFGAREWLGAGPLRVGVSTDQFHVSAGPWRIGLPFDKEGRFPDVTGIVPRPGQGTVGGIDDQDAILLRDRLPTLPGTNDDPRCVTVVLDRRVVLLTREGATGEVHELALTRSTASGPAVRVAILRDALARALALGCRTLRASEAGKPVAFEGGALTFLTLALDRSHVVSLEEPTVRIDFPPIKSPAHAAGERSLPVKLPPPNGHGSTRGQQEPPPGEPPDPLIEAEALRGALAEAAVQAGRLVMALKSKRKEQRALASAWHSLKALRLDGGAS